MSKKKIDTSGTSQSLSSNPFTSLNSQEFPEQISEPATSTTIQIKMPKKGRVVLRKETAHRAGKAVIVIYDFEPHISNQEIEDIGKALKKSCGSGGAVKGREIEIQGEQTQRIREYLTMHGFRVVGI